MSTMTYPMNGGYTDEVSTVVAIPPRRQTIVIGRPPMFEEIAERFPGALGPGVIFSWGDKIYSQSTYIHPALMVHEAVHGERQGDTEAGIVMWWRCYLVDPRFRFDEEWPAHVAELRWWQTQPRNARRCALSGIGDRLASPLYGNLITKGKAKMLLKQSLTSLGEQSTSA